jgi:hypothetical protein
METEAWEPIDFLAELRERAAACAEVIDLLSERAQSEAGRLWAPHLPQIIDAANFFRVLLQDEIDHYGEWRCDGLQPAEVIDFIDEDLDGFTVWLCRMTGTVVPCDEDQ